MHWDAGVPVPKPIKKVKEHKETGNKYKDRSITQEDQIAADVAKTTGIPMQRVKQSGANREKPGDVRSDRRIREPLHKLLIEAKIVGDVTSKGEKQLTIMVEWVDKILKEAVEERSIPMLIVQFKDDDRRFVLSRFEDQVRLLADNKQMSDFIDA